MRHPINTVLQHLPGGNKYRVIAQYPTQGSEYGGVYQFECIDFWCPEEMGDGITCWNLGERLYIASFHADSMQVWERADDSD
jgi:hypothetical protein